MDEIIVELSDDEKLQENIKDITKKMIENMSIAIPDVKIKAKPALMRRWYKEAEDIYDSKGNLLEWYPERIELWKNGRETLYNEAGGKIEYEKA